MEKISRYDCEETTVMIDSVEVAVFFDYLPPERGARDKHGLQETPDFPPEVGIYITDPEGYEKHPDAEQACWDAIEE